MKFIILALFCSVAFAAAQLQPAVDDLPRFRREANPQGSISIEAQKPMSGPDRRPSVDIDYNHKIYDQNGMNANAYGGLNIRPGQPAQPHVGMQFERNYRNGFIGGFGQVDRGFHGRPSPTFGVRGGFRFRRDVDEVMEDENAY
ncbi:unnamed protein product [Anthophora retusa]